MTSVYRGMPAILFVGFALLLALPLMVDAKANGTNADEVKVIVEARQGGEWFKVRREETDDDGNIEFKNALPGKYRFDIDDDDLASGQTLGVDVRMLDENGIRIDEKTDVDIYVYIGSTKVFAATVRSDSDGWIEIEGVQHNVVYELDAKDEMHLSSKDDQPRIKVDAKIDGSDWFRAAQKRVKNGVLEAKDMLPGKYKFKYKSKDRASAPASFTIHARMRDEDGKEADEEKVKIYAYPYGVRTFVAELKTDDDGWVTIPGAVEKMKYKISM